MPLIANTDLPTFSRLAKEGCTVLSPERAREQDIRELHIGLLNMMPDSALEATERQFFRLVGESNRIAQFYVHPFTLESLPRGKEALAHINTYYESFTRIKQDGLDALIITGANVAQPDLTKEPFWQPLMEVMDWAYHHVTSTLCSCLATHAVLQFRYNQKRLSLPQKKWGVFRHHVMDRSHPLVSGINTMFDVPHSRWNEVNQEQFENAGLVALVTSGDAGVHMAVSEDQFRLVYLQGHPEYDTQSLLKEYKREVQRFGEYATTIYPPVPDNYLGQQAQAILEEYQAQVTLAQRRKEPLPPFPEELLVPKLHNTWHDTALAVVSNWIGLVYQVTHRDRRIPFMQGVDPRDPLGRR